MLLLQLKVWSRRRRAAKESAVREMGVPDRIVNVATSHKLHLLEEAQCADLNGSNVYSQILYRKYG